MNSVIPLFVHLTFSLTGLHGVESYSQMENIPRLQFDPSEDSQELALTYSDSEVSREPSPLIFEFPGLMNNGHNQRAMGHDHIQRPSSDPTPTTLLPPVSLASGEVPHYDDLSRYMAPYGDDGRPQPTHDVEYFAYMPPNECVPSSAPYAAGRSHEVPTSFPPSPW